MKKSLLIAMVFVLPFIFSCSGPRAFTKGEYTDADRVILLDDRYNDSDMRIMADALVKSLMDHPVIKAKKKPPVLQVETVTNSTHEHIDMDSLTDKIRTALIKTGKVLFHDKGERKRMSDEYEYQNRSGNVDPSTSKPRGYQVGADYFMSGDFASHVQELGKKKVIYYKLTLKVTDIKTGLIVWTDEKEIKKLYKKRSYSM
ncbi:MAG: penicillin-binding protein activator LpoB [Oligoflexia bacterium]|nr:penicillin-binding protein activator LpoB [Oligoflexia bacterium]